MPISRVTSWPVQRTPKASVSPVRRYCSLFHSNMRSSAPLPGACRLNEELAELARELARLAREVRRRLEPREMDLRRGGGARGDVRREPAARIDQVIEAPDREPAARMSSTTPHSACGAAITPW